MQQEPITIIVITIVYMQLFVQWKDAEWYAVTHQEVPCKGGKYISFYTPSQIFQPLNIIQCSDFVPIQNFKTSQDGSVSAVCYSLDNQGIAVHMP